MSMRSTIFIISNGNENRNGIPHTISCHLGAILYVYAQQVPHQLQLIRPSLNTNRLQGPICQPKWSLDVWVIPASFTAMWISNKFSSQRDIKIIKQTRDKGWGLESIKRKTHNVCMPPLQTSWLIIVCMHGDLEYCSLLKRIFPEVIQGNSLNAFRDNADGVANNRRRQARAFRPVM